MEGKKLRSKSKKIIFSTPKPNSIYTYLTIFHYLFLEFKIWESMTRPNGMVWYGIVSYGMRGVRKVFYGIVWYVIVWNGIVAIFGKKTYVSE